jgi:hypothetical protein
MLHLLDGEAVGGVRGLGHVELSESESESNHDASSYSGAFRTF